MVNQWGSPSPSFRNFDAFLLAISSNFTFLFCILEINSIPFLFETI